MTFVKVYLTHSVDETIELGKKIGESCKGGEIIALIGDLGAGKTHLVKGIALGLNIDRVVTSPTFVISQIYSSGRLPLIHCDLYRLSSFIELEDMGWHDFIEMKGVIVIEWAEKIREKLSNEEVLWINMSIMDDTLRKISIQFDKNFEFLR